MGLPASGAAYREQLPADNRYLSVAHRHEYTRGMDDPCRESSLILNGITVY